MYPWNTQYLLRMLSRYVNRPILTDAVTPTEWLERLTDAQNQIVADLASIMPEVLYPTVAYGSIPTLTTTDNQNFTFGTDSNGFPLAPMGQVGIYRSLNDIPDYPMQPGFDYIPLGGTMIQAPNNTTLPSPLYWRGITPPGIIDLSGNHEPVLLPEGSRELIPLRAAINWASEGGRDPNTLATLSPQYGYPLANNPGRWAFWCQEWKTQYRGGGVLGMISGRQLAVGSAYNYGGVI